MKILTTFLILCLCFLNTILFVQATTNTNTPATFRAIFASCNKHDHPQEYWKNLVPKAIGKTDQIPQNFLDSIVWLGDIIYQDKQFTPVGPYFKLVNESELA
jgi:N-glycosylase/DNA lyase